MNIFAASTFTIALLLGVRTQAQNLILNGSFEFPRITINTYSSTVPLFWTVGGTPPTTPAFIHNGNSGDALTWPLPKHGQQFGDVSNQSGTTLSQGFTVLKQGIYILSWFDSAGHAGGLTASPYSVTIFDGLLHTVIALTNDAYHTTFGLWSARSQQLNLIPGTYTLQFRSKGVYSGLDSLLDNVSILGVSQGTAVATSISPAAEIVWLTVSNRTYQVQSTPSLNEPIWTDFGQPVIGDDTEKNAFDTTRDASKRFYRVIEVQ